MKTGTPRRRDAKVANVANVLIVVLFAAEGAKVAEWSTVGNWHSIGAPCAAALFFTAQTDPNHLHQPVSS